MNTIRLLRWKYLLTLLAPGLASGPFTSSAAPVPLTTGHYAGSLKIQTKIAADNISKTAVYKVSVRVVGDEDIRIVATPENALAGVRYFEIVGALGFGGSV